MPRAPSTGFHVDFESEDTKRAVDLLARLQGVTRAQLFVVACQALITQQQYDAIPGLRPLLPTGATPESLDMTVPSA